jgi:Domain of unknown function (DUF6798)
VGIHMTFLSSVVVVAGMSGDYSIRGLKENFWSYMRLPLTALLFGSPVLIPVFLDQMNQPLSQESLVVFTLYRAPHHFIPDAFNQDMTWRFFILFLTGAAGLFLMRPPGSNKLGTETDQFAANQQEPDRTRRILIAALSFISLVLIVAYLNVWNLQIATLTKLQLFKYSVSGKLILVTIISWVIGSRLSSGRVFEILTSLVHGRWLWQGTALAFFILVVSSWFYAPLTARNLPAVSRVTSPDAELYLWIQGHTPADAVFSIPPDHSGFSYYATRSQYVNFKAFPYHEDDIQEWYRRILTQNSASESSNRKKDNILRESGGVTDEVAGDISGGVPEMRDLVEIYESANDFSLYNFARKEGVQYVLRRNPLDLSGPSGRFSEVFRNRDWHLYRVEKTQQ